MAHVAPFMSRSPARDAAAAGLQAAAAERSPVAAAGPLTVSLLVATAS